MTIVFASVAQNVEEVIKGLVMNFRPLSCDAGTATLKLKQARNIAD